MLRGIPLWQRPFPSLAALAQPGDATTAMLAFRAADRRARGADVAGAGEIAADAVAAAVVLTGVGAPVADGAVALARERVRWSNRCPSTVVSPGTIPATMDEAEHPRSRPASSLSMRTACRIRETMQSCPEELRNAAWLVESGCRPGRLACLAMRAPHVPPGSKACRAVNGAGSR